MNHNVFTVEFFRVYRCQDGMQPEYLILYLVEGQADIWESNKHYHLQKDDFLIINSNRRHRVTLKENTLFLKIAVDYSMLNDIGKQQNLLFRCYSSPNKGIKYEKFRYFINELIGEYAIEPQGLNCRKMSCLYTICDFMVRMFRVSELAAIEQNDRTERILRYIGEHYCERISLEEIAEHVHMAPASFSRDFRKTMGITFVAYLTRVRLEYAANALLDSEYSISEIAMEHGFGSIPQFNKQFRNRFQMTPSEYRNAMQKMENMDGKEFGKNLMERLKDYRNKTRLTVIREDKVRIQAIEADVRAGERMRNPCTSIVNMGGGRPLAFGRISETNHILKTKAEL